MYAGSIPIINEIKGSKSIKDYDWWTFALAFYTAQEQIEKLQKFEFSGEVDLGVTIESNRNVLLIYITI